MKFITSIIVCLSFLMFFAPNLTSAQEGAGEEFGTILSEINISNATLVQEGVNTKVTFTVDNLGTKPEADILYGLEVIKVSEDGRQELVDTVVVKEPQTIVPGESDISEINYSSAKLASGNYEVWVLAQTPGGLVVGIALAGDIEVQSANTLEIKSDTCRLVVSGDDKQYLLSDGVDVSTTEGLVITCIVKNNTGETRSIIPNFVTHERSVFGAIVDINYQSVVAEELVAGEEKSLTLSLPLATKPQAYDLVLTYKTTDGSIDSNQAVIHYVIQGQSATIQNVTFSKDTYLAGEEIGLNILWSASADTFRDSRSGGTEKTEAYYFDVKVTDLQGQLCGSSREEIREDSVSIKVPSLIPCSNPTATVELGTAAGVILDSESVTVVRPDQTTVEEVSDVNRSVKSNNLYIVISLLALIGIVLLLWYARKNKNNIIADSINSLVLVMVFCAGLLSSYGTAEAVTWSYSEVREDCSIAGGDGGVCVSYNYTYATAVIGSNKTTYAPGETITLSGTVRNHACSNVNYGLSANLSGAQTSLLSATFSGTRNVSGTLAAPSSPGNYTINLNLCIGNQRSCAAARINITVANPAVNGRCGASHYQCSAGTSASNSNNATNYTWRCNGISGGSNASCSETKINGSCGTTANTCSAGSVAGVSQNGTQYIWSCNSPNGGSNASCSANIPPTVTLVADPILVGPGLSSTLTWTVARATSCTASGGWSGSKSVSGGGESVNPAVSSAYTISCTGPGGTVSATANVNTPSGSISVTPPCSIPLGGSSCTVTVNWNRSNFLGTPLVSQGTTQFSTSPNGPVNRTVTPDNRTFTLRDSGSTFSLSALADVTCGGNGRWISSLNTCMAVPVITVVSNPDIVRRGDTAPVTITVTSNSNLSCVVTGAVNANFAHTAGASAVTYPFTSEPLISARLVEVTCTDTTYPEVTGSASARINVIPSIEEI